MESLFKKVLIRSVLCALPMAVCFCGSSDVSAVPQISPEKYISHEYREVSGVFTDEFVLSQQVIDEYNEGVGILPSNGGELNQWRTNLYRSICATYEDVGDRCRALLLLYTSDHRYLVDTFRRYGVGSIRRIEFGTIHHPDHYDTSGVHHPGYGVPDFSFSDFDPQQYPYFCGLHGLNAYFPVMHTSIPFSRSAEEKWTIHIFL